MPPTSYTHTKQIYPVSTSRDIDNNITSADGIYVQSSTSNAFDVYYEELYNVSSDSNTTDQFDANILGDMGKNEQLIIFYILMTVFLLIFICLITQLQDCEMYLMIVALYKLLCPCLNRPSKLYTSMSNAFEQETSSIQNNRYNVHKTSSSATNSRQFRGNNHKAPSFKSLSGGKLSALAVHESLSKTRSSSHREPKLIQICSDADIAGKDMFTTLLIDEEGPSDRLTLLKQKKYLEKQLAVY